MALQIDPHVRDVLDYFTGEYRTVPRPPWVAWLGPTDSCAKCNGTWAEPKRPGQKIPLCEKHMTAMIRPRKEESMEVTEAWWVRPVGVLTGIGLWQLAQHGYAGWAVCGVALYLGAWIVGGVMPRGTR